MALFSFHFFINLALTLTGIICTTQKKVGNRANKHWASFFHRNLVPYLTEGEGKKQGKAFELHFFINLALTHAEEGEGYHLYRTEEEGEKQSKALCGLISSSVLLLPSQKKVRILGTVLPFTTQKKKFRNRVTLWASFFRAAESEEACTGVLNPSLV